MLGHPYNLEKAQLNTIPNDSSNVAMTYTALITLLILGDDLKNVHKSAVLACIKALQQPDGSFVSVLEGSESDMPFVYCACCVCFVLEDWSGMEKEKAIAYVKQNLTPVIQALGIILHDEKIWPSPQKFDPDRFSKENMRNKITLLQSCFWLALANANALATNSSSGKKLSFFPL